MKLLVIFFTSFLVVLSVQGQTVLKSELRTNGPETQKAFKSLKEALFESSALIYDPSFADGRRHLQLGTVVSEDGHVLTKASTLKDVSGLSVRIGKALYKEVEILAQSEQWDLMLLKVDAEIVGADFAESSEISQGTWLVMNGPPTRRERRVRAGILSAHTRKIGSAPASIGVRFVEESHELIVKEVLENSGALDAGIKEGDKIIQVDGKEVSGVVEYSESLEEREPGEKVAVMLLRDGEEMSFDIELKRARDILGRHILDRNDAMSGSISIRREDFPRVLQHDIYCTPRTIGGPVHLLDGKCIGMNIARADRVTTFAIPLEELKMIFEELKE